MADTTGISWADSTFNPWMGCTKISPACDHCYAERDTKRFGRVVWGPGQQRVRTSAAYWRQPLHWNQQPFYECDCGARGSMSADVPDSRLFWSDGQTWSPHDGQRGGVDLVARVGKKVAGRLLDGAIHDAFPVVRA